jgi:hypothetical protein
MYLQKEISRKNFFKICFLLVDPDPLVRGMDPRIRIYTKMSWIRNTGYKVVKNRVPHFRDKCLGYSTCTVYSKEYEYL